jgi:hypothetical protein
MEVVICSGVKGEPGCPGRLRDVSKEEMNALIVGEGHLSGNVVKAGMLPGRKWYRPSSITECSFACIIHPMPLCDKRTRSCQQSWSHWQFERDLVNSSTPTEEE